MFSFSVPSLDSIISVIGDVDNSTKPRNVNIGVC